MKNEVDHQGTTARDRDRDKDKDRPRDPLLNFKRMLKTHLNNQHNILLINPCFYFISFFF